MPILFHPAASFKCVSVTKQEVASTRRGCPASGTGYLRSVRGQARAQARMRDWAREMNERGGQSLGSAGLQTCWLPHPAATNFYPGGGCWSTRLRRKCVSTECRNQRVGDP